MSERVLNPAPPTRDDRSQLAEQTVALVRHWLTESAKVPADKAALRLAGMLKDPAGLPFTVGFIDGVIRPEDPRVAARNFATLSRQVPAFLPRHLRAAIRVGGVVGLLFPALVIPVITRVLRSMVGHLVVDARPARLGRSIAKLRKSGVRLNMNLLGEAVLGEHEADRRLRGTHELLARPDVDYVSIKVSSTVAPHSVWAFAPAVADVVERLTPLFAEAAAAPSAKFINLDMEEYRDLDLTIAVFTTILDKPEFLQLEAGIVLQAYLPDALAAMMRLQAWSAARRARGGAGIKVRLVKGANLPMERVEASLHGWPLATWCSKQETDTNYKRVLDYALTGEHIDNVRIGIAGHNLFDIAHAWLLADRRGVRDGIEFEMLLGMAQGQAEVIRNEVGGLLLYTPVVDPHEFDVAIAYLVRRLEEGASQDNFMSAMFELNDNEALFEREKERFLASFHAVDSTVPLPHRQQNRLLPPTADAADQTGAFHNAQDTDWSLPANRQWADAILDKVAGSQLGRDLVEEYSIAESTTLDEIIGAATEAGRRWGARTGAERAGILEAAAHSLELRRAELAEVMAAETGKTLDQSDPEVSEAIDFARYYATLARELDDVDGAEFVPSRLTVVTPPWNFPIAIPAGSTLAALAAGSAVILKPATQSARCGSVLADALWAAGVPRDVLRLVHVTESGLGRQLVSDPRVDRLILTGAYQTAELFKSFRADLPLLAETSGKNAIIVTPSADLDLAVKDIVHSAFAHAGQKCSATSIVVLVGSVANSPRFRRQLIDATTSLTVGPADDPASQVPRLIEPARGKLLAALTTLDEGESWLVEPRRLDDAGQYWSPGVRTGVRRGATAHLVEFFGPVLAVMTADTLDEAIAIVNEVDYGLTSGLHSLDPQEIARWLAHIEAGNLYINRGTTGAIVRRQPFGGWKKSVVGAGFKAGGPNYLVGLGNWSPARHRDIDEPLDERVLRILDAAAGKLAAAEVESLRRAFASDAQCWRTMFGVARDVSNLSAERNLFRYRPTAVHLRLAEDASPAALLRVLGAARITGAPAEVSLGPALPAWVGHSCLAVGQQATVQTDAQWLEDIAERAPARIRLISGDAHTLAERIGGRPDIAVYDQPVTESGRLELLPFLREQAVSITAHRFGTPNHLTDAII